MKSVSLILGSGGARGLSHIGVIHWLEESDYAIKSISGCSMGALIGGIYAAGKLNEFESWGRTPWNPGRWSFETSAVSMTAEQVCSGLPLGEVVFARREFKMTGSQQLLCAAAMSFAASVLHVAVVFGGPSWYRLFGAGEGMAALAERGSIQPTLITLGIAAVLFVCGLYALSGAAVILKLPLLRFALVTITLIYLLRGVAGFVLPFLSDHPAIAQNSVMFWMVSSLICCLFGVLHLLGTINSWAQLAGKGT